MSKREISKRDVIMIIVAAALLITMGIGLYHDRTSALIDRTNPYEFSQDENLSRVATEKKGFLFKRVYYEVKFRIVDDYWEQYYMMFRDLYDAPGKLMDVNEFKTYSEEKMKTTTLKPIPQTDTLIWLSGFEYDDHALIYIISEETDGHAYFYIYYSRK